MSNLSARLTKISYDTPNRKYLQLSSISIFVFGLLMFAGVMTGYSRIRRHNTENTTTDLLDSEKEKEGHGENLNFTARYHFDVRPFWGGFCFHYCHICEG